MDYEDCSSSSASSSSNEHLPSTPNTTTASSSHVPTMTPSPKRKAGRKKFKETRHPVYRGVRERNGGKWVCEVREPNKKSRIWLGTYQNPEMAARAHDVAALALRGKSAALNFPDSAWVLPRAQSAAADDIRRAAAEAAEMFRCGNSPAKSSSSSSSPKVRPSVLVIKEEERRPPAVFVDEEAVFNMHGLVNEMAEGLMLTPPAMEGGFDWDGAECHMDFSLWSN